MRIVVVYLGDSIPKHFWLHVQHLLDIQSKYQIDIITSREILEIPIQDPRLHNFVYEPRPEITEILDSLEMDTKFRGGFWRYSLERLFAFTQHHLDFSNDSILHIESDLLPLRNFPFSKFENVDKLFWSRVGANYDVAAIVFSPNQLTSNWLDEKMINVMYRSKEMTDMRVLGEISALYPHLVSALPSIPKINSQITNADIDISSANLEAIHKEFSTFEGIFDPAGIGIWLTGTEPRNFFGVSKKFDTRSLVNSKAFLNPGRVKFHFQPSGQLIYIEDGMNIPIYTLHIHSKNLDYFGCDFERYLARDVLGSNVGKTRRTFSFRILFALIFHNWRKGTLLRFISWHPVFRRIKRTMNRIKND
jgi:hypothetical protein